MDTEKNFNVIKAVDTNTEMSEINKFTLRELVPEEVFCFKVKACDNQVDRDFEAFSDKALAEIAEKIVGKTMLFDHNAKAENQNARVYKSEIIEENGVKSVIAYCYIVKTGRTSDLIKEIEGGIKKEVSVSCSVAKRVCSICGSEKSCRHNKGSRYDEKLAYRILDGCTDFYEISFVAVPAQRAAGTTKNFSDTATIEGRLRLLEIEMEENE